MSLEVLVSRLVKERLGYDKWFRAEVRKGIDDIAAGRVFSNEEVWDRLEAHMARREASGSHSSPGARAK